MEKKICYECRKEVTGRAVKFWLINPFENFVVHENECYKKAYSKVDRKRIRHYYQCRVNNGIASGPVKY